MRYIEKTGEPRKFTEWKASENDDWQPTYDKLSGDVKKAVYDSLLTEQGGICCYCERELREDKSHHDYHIEHLDPKYKNRLDYSNFLCSCLRDTEKGEPRHCGHAKKAHEISVHPLQPDCQSKFTFTAAGEIIGLDQNAKDTITILGLNIRKLINMRSKAFEIVLDPDLNRTELKKFVSTYVKRTQNGELNPFVSAVACVARRSNIL